MSQKGFTFLEVLISLVVLGILVATLTRMHAGVIRARAVAAQQARTTCLARSVFCTAYLGSSSVLDDARDSGEWQVDVTDPREPDGTNVWAVRTWRVALTNEPLSAVEIHLPVSPSPPSAGDTRGGG